MKPPRSFRFFHLWVFATGALAGASFASTQYYWNAGGTGGDGNWGSSPGDKNWNTIAGAAPAGNIAWPDTIDDVAVFQDPLGGTVTVFDVVQTSGIIQSGANYTINAGTITLVRDSALTSPSVDVQSGILTIDSTLDGTDGLVKLGDGALHLTNTNTYSGATVVTAGSLTLSGTLLSGSLNIGSNGAFINENGGLTNSTILTNAGALTLNASDTVAQYTSDGGTLTASPGTLFTDSAALNQGSTVAGIVNTGSLTSNGSVLINGSVTANSSHIQSGNLTLAGKLTSSSVNIAAGAGFIDQNGGLANRTNLTNAGSLTLKKSETVASYTSNGGTLAAGPGTLVTPTANLNHGSMIAGRLDADSIFFNGAASNSGVATADTISLSGGIVSNTGILGTNDSMMDIGTGATLVAAGRQRYSLLTTSGPAAGTWHGNLDNRSAIAPGGKGDIGSLNVVGNFTNTPSGVLHFDISANRHDRLSVTGTATFDGTISLNQLGSESIAPFIPISIVSASSYQGDITSLTENLEGSIWFNPGNGTITRIALPTANTNSLFGATENQSSTWAALYDDVIDPGVANITHHPGATPEYKITSGLADEENPDLMWALSSSFSTTGLNAELLNRLSPEVYTSFSDYATQATRTHQRTALSAPPLAPLPKADSKSGLSDDSKGSAKDSLLTNPSKLQWELFAAADYFNVETDNSRNLADYELNGMGVIAGARTRIHDQIQLAGYLAVDDGSVSGPLIDADQIGWSVGLISETMLDEKSRTRLIAAASYGRYSFDGSRESVSATSARWMPGDVDFSNVNSHSLELFVGVETLAYQKGRYRLTPSAGFRYASGSLDNFTEGTTTAPGSPIALEVDRDSHDSLLFEMAALAEADLTDQLTLWSQLGFNAGISEDPHNLDASFVKGGRQMNIVADGLTDDLIFIGLGAEYRINDSVSVGVGYRGDFRPSHHAEHGCSLSSSFRF